MRKSSFFVPVIFTAGVVAGLSLAGCTVENAGDVEPPVAISAEDRQKEFDRMIEGLGVNTSWAPQSDMYGNPLPDNYNPLGTASTPGSRKGFHKTDELYLDWVSINEYDRAWQMAWDETLEPKDPYADAETLETYSFWHFMCKIWTYDVVHQSAFYEDFQDGWTASNNGLVTLKNDISDQEWMRMPKKAVSADIDGDGYEEVIIAAADCETGKILVRMGRKDDGRAVCTSEVFNFDYTGGLNALRQVFPANFGFDLSITTNFDGKDEIGLYLMENEFQFYGIDMAAGDIDGDGLPEIVLSVGRQVYILDRGNPEEVALGENPNTSWTALSPHDPYSFKSASTVVSVACADFNSDGYCDWVETVANISERDEDGWVRGTAVAAEYVIYDGSTYNAEDAYVEKFEVSGAAGEIPGSIMSANIVTGDFDGDGVPETAFCGRDLCGGNYKLVVLNTDFDENAQLGFAFLPATISISASGHIAPENRFASGSSVPALASGDLNGDGKDEIFAVSKIFGINDGGAVSELWYQQNPGNADPGNNTFYDVIAVGDVNGDGKADILYLDWYGRLIGITFEEGEYKYLQLTDQGSKLSPNTPLSNHMYGLTFPETPVPTGIFPVLALANIDDGGYIMEYQGSEFAYSNPVPVAVVAAPPVYKDVTYPYSVDYRTFYGDAGQSGHIIQADANVSLRIGGADGEEIDGSNLAALFGWGLSGPPMSSTTNVAIMASTKNDIVAYTAVPYYIYTYAVASSPAHNTDGQDKAEVTAGSILRFSYPGRMAVYTQTLDYYNLHNGNCPDVSSPYMIGEPFSYPNLEALDNLKSLYGGRGVYDSLSSYATIYSEDTWNQRSVSQVAQEEKDLNWEFSVTTENLNAAGTTDTHQLLNKIVGTLRFEGQVPDLPVASKPNYRWGLLLYPYTDPESNIIYNQAAYWVDEE